jgi:tetratricopeptide (TPR) repeat protein
VFEKMNRPIAKSLQYLLLTATLFCQTIAGLALQTSDNFINDAYKQLNSSTHPTETLMNELAEVVQKDPHNYQAHFFLGTCYYRLGLPDQAMAEFRLAAQYGPNDPAPLIKLINQAVENGQTELAREVASVGIGRFPSNPELSFWQANFVLLKENKLEEADKLFTQASQSKIQIPNLDISIATLRLAQGRLDDAYYLARKQLVQTPEAAGAFLVIGDIHYRRKEFISAYPWLKKAYGRIIFTPNLARKYMQTAYWTGHYEQALEPAIVQMALSSSKEFDDINCNNIFIDSAKHVPKERLAEIVKTSSLTLDQNARYLQDPSFHRGLGECLSKLGMHDLAETEFSRCIKRNPSDGLATYLLAKELELYRCDYEQALKYYKTAKLLGAPVNDIDLYIAHLQSRLETRHQDMAWQLKDWLHKRY